MRLAEFGIILVLIVGVFLVLAFGFNNNEAPAVNDVTLTAADNCGGSCADCDKEPVVSASIDFSQNGEYNLDTGKLSVRDGKVYVADCCGNNIGVFAMGSEGKVVPSGSQPNGNIVKSAYSGPPGDTRSTYRVYPASFGSDSSVKPHLAVDFAGGVATVTSGSDIGRTRAKSFEGKGIGYGGSVSGASGGGCASSGSGGG